MGEGTPREPNEWHAEPANRVLERLAAGPDGLSSEEAAERLARFGPNELRSEEKQSPVIAFLNQFRSPLIYVLLFAAALSLAARHAVDAVVILAIVILNSVIGFTQEHRAERALEALKKLSALQASVIRNGEETNLDAAELVPGDIIMLEAGQRVPADGRILQAANLTVDEAALTGESAPVEKTIEPMPDDAPLAERRNMIYSGTTAVFGRGTAVLTETGMSTEIGRIATAVMAEPRQLTPVQRQLARMAGYLGIAGLLIAVAVILAGAIRRLDLYQMFFLGVAAAVSFIPEGLPAVITVVLAVGVQRMARRCAVVRKLPAVETLGSATVICTDKTGTLTKNELTVRAGYTAETSFTVTGEGYAPEGGFYVGGQSITPEDHPDVEFLLTALVLCNDARLHDEEDGDYWKIIGDPTEGSLVVAGEKLGLKKHDLEADQPRIDEIPFDSRWRFMATLHQLPDGRKVAYVKGAPERIISMSARYHLGNGPAPLNDELRGRFAERDAEMGSGALRVLAVAYKEFTPEVQEIEHKDVEGDLVFIGAVGMMDPPREEARDSLQAARQAGIRVIMVTGDHAETARSVAEQIGLLDEGMRVAPGRDLNSMSDDQLTRAIGRIAVFSRAEPEHKLRIVRALQVSGQIVAMTGDGVNDAPALKLADIGIAMGITGTDVAKEASDIVLVDDNFATIISAVEEGRSIFANIRRVILYLISTNSGEILIYLSTILAGLPIPLLPVQILWINLVTDGFSTAPLAFEPKEPGILREPPRSPREPIINRPTALRIAFYALLMWVGVMMVYVWALEGLALDRARTYAFILMALFQVFNVLNVRSHRHSVFGKGFFSNPWVLVGISASILAQIAAVQTPFFQSIFHTTPISLGEWVLLFLAAGTILWADEVRKLVLRLIAGRR